MKHFLLALAILAAPARALDFDNPRDLHDVAHVGIGFTVGTGAYGAWKLLVQPEDRWVAIVFGTLTSALIAGSWELSAYNKGKQPSAHDFGMSMLGAGSATAAVLVFGF